MGLLHKPTMTTRTLSSLLLVALLVLLLGTAAVSGRVRPSRVSRGSGSSGRGLRQCQTVPPFRVNNVEPLLLARGQVALAALLTSTCTFCLSQATRLQNLLYSLQSSGANVHMMIINGGPRPSPGENGPFERRVSFPVYHDNSRTIWRQRFHGNKDDIFIIDRCGKLTYRIPFPYSYLGYNYVSRALQRTLTQNICNCSLENQDLHNRMLGDAPALDHSGQRIDPGPGRYQQGRNIGKFHGRSGSRMRGSPSYSLRNLNRSRCRRNDRLCRDLRNARQRYNRFRRQYGIHSHSGMPQEQILQLFQHSQRGMSMGPAF